MINIYVKNWCTIENVKQEMQGEVKGDILLQVFRLQEMIGITANSITTQMYVIFA